MRGLGMIRARGLSGKSSADRSYPWRMFSGLGVMLLCLIAFQSPVSAQRKVEEIVTPLGIKAWLVEERSIPLISIKFALQGGSMQDPNDKGGGVSLLASLLTEGAGELTAEVFARRVAETGAQIGFSATRDQLHGSLDTLSSRFEATTELLRLAVTSPRLDPESIERARQQRLADLEHAASEPRGISLDAWHAATFPGHPYGRPVHGTPASIRLISASDLKLLHSRLFSKGALRVVIVGNIDRANATRALDQIFGGLQSTAAATPAPRPEARRVPEPIKIVKPLPVATAAFGSAALSPDHPDHPALQVLNHIIGSGDFDSTLMDEIRVKRGLAYAVAVSLTNDTSASVMLGGMATKPENMGEALVALKASLQRTASDGPTAEQVENAKLYLTGSHVLDLDTNTKLAAYLMRLWLSGRAPDQLDRRNEAIRRVTLEDVRRVARSQLSWDRQTLVLVGP